MKVIFIFEDLAKDASVGVDIKVLRMESALNPHDSAAEKLAGEFEHLLARYILDAQSKLAMQQMKAEADVEQGASAQKAARCWH